MHMNWSLFSFERISGFALVLTLLTGCTSRPKSNQIKFSSLSSAETGIHFANTISESDSVNLITNEYLYTGSGVGIGDFNNDGLQDVFFGSNQQTSKLYINKGAFAFEDVTDKAGLTTDSFFLRILYFLTHKHKYHRNHHC